MLKYLLIAISVLCCIGTGFLQRKQEASSCHRRHNITLAEYEILFGIKTDFLKNVLWGSIAAIPVAITIYVEIWLGASLSVLITLYISSLIAVEFGGHLPDIIWKYQRRSAHARSEKGECNDNA